METQERDAKVYEVIARKQETKWCRVSFYSHYYDWRETCELGERYYINKWELQDDDNFYYDHKIIGHAIVLSDILHYIWESWRAMETASDTLIFWLRNWYSWEENMWDLSKPTYEEQSEECKNFIYSLIK